MYKKYSSLQRIRYAKATVTNPSANRVHSLPRWHLSSTVSANQTDRQASPPIYVSCSESWEASSQTEKTMDTLRYHCRCTQPRHPLLILHQMRWFLRGTQHPKRLFEHQNSMGESMSTTAGGPLLATLCILSKENFLWTAVRDASGALTYNAPSNSMHSASSSRE